MFRQGLAERGWTDGQNIIIDMRVARAPDDLSSLALELVAEPVDMLVTATAVAIAACKRATGTIPIVFCVSGDPISIGLVKSLAHPDGNDTGLSLLGPELYPKRLELLRELVPPLMRIAFLQNFANPTATASLDQLHKAGGQTSISVSPLDVRTDADLRRAFETASQLHVDGLVIGDDAIFNLQQLGALCIQLAAQYRLPAVGSNSITAEAGGLITYGPNLDDLLKRAATEHVDPILRGEKSPADLPVQQPTMYDLTINVPAAQALGISIPTELLTQATKVIQ
jgi:putative ABC transport system substrate-binding protein